MVKSIFNTYRNAYAGLPRAAWLLAGVQLINTSGSMVIFFLTLYLTRKLGFSITQAGQAISIFGIGVVIGALSAGHLTDRIGAHTMQKASLSCTGILLITLGFMRTYPLVLLFTFLYGLSNAALWPANASAMATVCPGRLRPRGFVLIRLANNLGATIGPVVGGFLALVNYQLLFWIDGATCLLAALAFSLLFPHAHPIPHTSAESNEQERRIWWRDRAFLGILVSCIGINLIFSQLFSTFPIYMRTVYQLAENRIGPLLAINTSLIVLFQMVLTHALESFRKRNVVALGALALGCGFAMQQFGSGFLFAAVTVAVWTLGEMLTLPILTTMVSLRAGPQNQGKYQGLFSLSFSIATIFGPYLGTRIYTHWGPDWLWSATGVVGLLIAGGYFLAERRAKTVNCL